MRRNAHETLIATYGLHYAVANVGYGVNLQTNNIENGVISTYHEQYPINDK